MAFTELYVQTTGSNLNAGSTTADAASLTYASGDWVQSTGVFTVASGDPSADGVAVGDFASVYADGSSVTGFVGRVTARDTTTITVSLTAKSGTAPTDGTGNRTLKIGGAWAGPNGASAFPFGFLQVTHTNSSGDIPRVNIKGGTTYSITAPMTHGTGGAVFQGYTSSVGDGGRATIDGGTSGASYVLLTNNSAPVILADLIFQNNGATGSASGVVCGARTLLSRCVFTSVRGHGVSVTSGPSTLLECEAYACNQSNTANLGGFASSNTTVEMIRCISHDNAGSNNNGFFITAGRLRNCIADSNGLHGIFELGTVGVSITNCDVYDNGTDGIRLGNTGTGANMASTFIENTNAIANGGYGINGSGAGDRIGLVRNCGFGAGTQANGSGTTTGLKSMVESGSVTYPDDATPWTDPANGNFTITLDEALAAGRGSFTETAAGYGGTTAAPCIGAAQPSAGSPSAAEIADAVWDELRSGHVSAGSFGEYVRTQITEI